MQCSCGTSHFQLFKLCVSTPFDDTTRLPERFFCRELFSSAAAHEFEREVCQLRRYYSCFMSKSYSGRIVLEVRQMEISFHNKIFDINYVNLQIWAMKGLWWALNINTDDWRNIFFVVDKLIWRQTESTIIRVSFKYQSNIMNGHWTFPERGKK